MNEARDRLLASSTLAGDEDVLSVVRTIGRNSKILHG